MATQTVHDVKGVNIPAAAFTDQAVYIKTVRDGIPGTVVKQAIHALGGNRELFIRLFNTTSANLSRYYRKKVLNRTDSEEVLDTLRVYLQALQVFGDEKTAREWLNSPIAILAGERPLELFDTFEGRNLVRATLRKLEYGEFT
ncbi:MAG: DUF2384 domain-containing protein [Gammaproteobacteria bacterium]|nr:DUF2384 domain-containing protein [Gammaproteobacteria bacterium]